MLSLSVAQAYIRAHQTPILAHAHTQRYKCIPHTHIQLCYRGKDMPTKKEQKEDDGETCCRQTAKGKELENEQTRTLTKPTNQAEESYHLLSV